MLKIYRRPNGRTYQYEESEAPKDAVEVKPTKARKPANKKRKVADK